MPRPKKVQVEVREHRRVKDDVKRIAKRLTRDELEEHLVRRERVVASQMRELRNLRAELREANRKLEDCREIDRAVNELAALRVKQDAVLPRPEPVLFKDEGRPNHGGRQKRERTRCATHPQALAVVLADLQRIVDDFRLDQEEIKEFESVIEGLQEERGKMLRMLGMDEWEWSRIGWRM